MLQATFDVNSQQRDRVYRRLVRRLRPNNGHVATVAVLGLSFKPGTDDVRESPAMDIIFRLLEAGIRVQAHDPVAIESARNVLSDVRYCEDPYDALRGCDAALIATDWRDYALLDWRRVHALMRHPTVIDGRNLLNATLMRSHGFVYEPVGRGRSRMDDAALNLEIGAAASAG
jgi:UDPglucose 6-dehydrogenase